MSAEVTESKNYHHGELKAALLEAAWEVIDAGGLDKLTMRELSRRVGVSHAAPYHHFKNRDALLDALRQEAFAGFTEALADSGKRARSPDKRLFEMGRAYIDFARRYPARMGLMFTLRPCEAEVSETERRSFEVLVDAIVALQKAGMAPKGDPSRLALLAFSAVHGFAKLWAEGPISAMPPYEATYEKSRDQMLRTLIRGFMSERVLADRERSETRTRAGKPSATKPRGSGRKR
ncbi:MAG: TetR/AcrR family transcriptional regulator [Sandaracinaceae bacterium]|nr:TetR/AcrR family transcriptional regulator [Sandaracinaceae bacterium]